MADAKKLKELQERISDQKSKLDKAKMTMGAEKDPDKLVELKRIIAGIENTIGALEHTYNVASYEPPEPTDAELLLVGVNAYIKEKQEKVQKVQDNIDKALAEQEETESALQAAVERGDADDVIKLSKQRDGISEKLKYLYQMREKTAALKTFPEGAIAKEWEKVCLKNQDEWNALLLRIEVLADEYRKACDELISMNNFLVNVRTTMQNMGKQDGVATGRLPQILTVGLDVSPMVISKVEGNKPFHITGGIGSNYPL